MMNIEIIPYSQALATSLTGGEWAVSNLQIYIDPELPYDMRRNLVIHAVIENYNSGLCHDKVDELTDSITDALDRLGWCDIEAKKSSPEV